MKQNSQSCTNTKLKYYRKITSKFMVFIRLVQLLYTLRKFNLPDMTKPDVQSSLGFHFTVITILFVYFRKHIWNITCDFLPTQAYVYRVYSTIAYDI